MALTVNRSVLVRDVQVESVRTCSMPVMATVPGFTSLFVTSFASQFWKSEFLAKVRMYTSSDVCAVKQETILYCYVRSPMMR